MAGTLDGLRRDRSRLARSVQARGRCQIRTRCFSRASTASLITQAKGGKARILAVSGDKRVAALPDVPTFAEAGLRQYGILNFNGLWAPKGTPPEILARLQSEVAKAAAAPDVKAFFDSQGGSPGGTKSDAFARQVAETTRMWAPVAERAKVERQ